MWHPQTGASARAEKSQRHPRHSGLVTMVPDGLPSFGEVGLDGRVLLFSLGAARVDPAIALSAD